MDDLAAFINSRLDENEAAAREVQANTATGRYSEAAEGSSPAVYWDIDYDHGGYTITADRVLAYVESTRRILAEVVENVWSMEATIQNEWGVGADPGPSDGDQLLKLIALPFASHPDYREEWKP